MQDYASQMLPFCETYINDEAWAEYMSKFELMTRDRITVALKNTARQRRGAKRVFADLNILINEANYSDDALIT